MKYELQPEEIRPDDDQLGLGGAGAGTGSLLPDCGGLLSREIAGDCSTNIESGNTSAYRMEETLSVSPLQRSSTQSKRPGPPMRINLLVEKLLRQFCLCLGTIF